MSLKIPSDFAKKIADTLNRKLTEIEETLDFHEDKDGYFWATLKPKKVLDKPDFIAVCRLTRDLGGEDYLKGAKAWRVPGALAKKGTPDRTPDTQKPSGHGIDSQPAYKEPGNALPTEPSSLTPRVLSIRLEAISIPTFLPTREALTHEKLQVIRDSIKKHGLKYPIKVRPGPQPGTYELIDGYLRLTSAQQLSWKEIPAEVSERTDEQVIIESVITNKDRLEEDPITLAKKLDILVNAFQWTQEKLAQELGIDQSTVSHHIRLLQLPKEVQHYVALHNVSFYHALQLLTLKSPELQTRLANEVVKYGLSTRDLETRILELQPKPETPQIPEKHEEAGPPRESRGPEKQISCARCGEPIEGTPIHLGEGKYYDAECAEQVVAESKAGALPEEHVGPFEEESPKETGAEPKKGAFKRHAIAPMPSGIFDVIYADPPWDYDVNFLRSSPDQHYGTLTTEEIAAMKIPASQNAVLFLWTTNPFLEKALRIMERWGFTYKTNMVWVKPSIGLGFYFRGQHELLLVGVKGDVHPPEESKRFSSVLQAETREHSAKPERVYEIIEAMYPTAKARAELFARKKRVGWTSWGDEIDRVQL
jgi:ParB/RepB/Spo0J family partition protein